MKLALGRLGSAGTRTLIQRAIASLRARGSDAHLWLPGGDVRTYGAELVVNGDFSNGTTGWTGIRSATVSNPSGKLIVTQGGDVYGGVSTPITLVIGRTYVATVTIDANAGSADLFVFVAENNTGSVNRSLTYDLPIPNLGTYTTTFTAITASSYIVVSAGGGGFDASESFTIDNISVREITSITPTITSGLTTGNYLESTGNSVATVNNPCGLVLDALGSVGAELVIPSLPAFNSTITNGGVFPTTATSTVNGVYGFVKNSVLTASKYYRFTITWSGNTSGKAINVGDGTNNAVLPATASGSGTFGFISSGSQIYAFISGGLIGESFTINSLSVREVSGIHLTQGTTANKAVLRRGAVNLLTYSDSIYGGTGAWTLNAGVVQTANNALSPSGTMTATRIFADGTGINQGIYLSAVATVGATQTFSLWLKGAVGGEQVYIGDATDRIAVTLTAAWARYNTPGQVRASNHTVIYALNNTAMTFYASQAQLVFGSAAGDYSPTTTAAGSNPDAGKYSWSFDSTDVLSATIPAGWETATIIDAAPTGAVASVQNVVGTHSIRGAMVTGVNLVTNGGFDTDTTGWTANTATLSIVSGALQVEWLSGVSYAKQIIPTVVGLTYQLNVKFIKGTAAAGLIYCGPTAGTATYVNSSPSAGSDLSFTFTATSTTAHLQLYCGTNSAGNNSLYDNISVYEINPVTHARILVKGTLTEAETNLYKSLANSFK